MCIVQHRKRERVAALKSSAGDEGHPVSELELELEHPAEAEQAHQVSHGTGGDAGSTGEEPLVGEGEMEMGPQAGPGAADGQSAPPDGAAVIPEDDRERKRGGAHRRGRVDWGTIGAWRHGVTLTVG